MDASCHTAQLHCKALCSFIESMLSAVAAKPLITAFVMNVDPIVGRKRTSLYNAADRSTRAAPLPQVDTCLPFIGPMIVSAAIVEEAFSKPKHVLSEIDPSRERALVDAMGPALGTVGARDNAGYLAHCGYRPRRSNHERRCKRQPEQARAFQAATSFVSVWRF
jgi:hypothetical protein